MTTRFSGFQVTLADDIREDDAVSVINAIRMIKGVRDVRPFEAATFSPEITRIRLEVADKLQGYARDILTLK